MPFNLTIWKINNFYLILYGEISVLIGPIPRLFVTGAFKLAHYSMSCHFVIGYGIFLNPGAGLSFNIDKMYTINVKCEDASGHDVRAFYCHMRKNSPPVFTNLPGASIHIHYISFIPQII